MQISRIVLVASLLFFSTPKAIALPIASANNLNRPIRLVQNIASEEDSIWKNAALGSLAIALAEVGDRDRLVEIFNRIDNPDVRGQILVELGLRSIEKGDIKFASSLLENERDIRLFSEIFRNLIAEENTDRAWDLVQLTNGEDNRILLLFVEAAIANQKYDRAWEILQTLDSDILQLISWRGLAFGFAELGRGDRILEIVDRVEENETKQDFTLLAALALAEDDRPQQALDIVPRLERDINRVHALGAIGLKFIENGARDRGEKQFDRLRELLPQLEANGQTNSVLSNLSTYLARGGEFTLALELSDRISTPSTKTEALFYIARSLGEAGEFSRALDLSLAIDVSGLRENSIQQIAVNLAKNNQSDRALSILQPLTNTDETLKEIATILAEQEQFDRALEVAENIQSTELKTIALGAIAFHLHQNQNSATARAILQQTFQLWETFVDPMSKDTLLGLIVLPFVESEFYDLSLELLHKTNNLLEKNNTLRDAIYTVAETGKRQESLQFIALMEDEIEQIGALIFLAVQLDRQNRQEDAIVTLVDALERSQNLPNPEQKALLLSSIATQFAELGRSRKASEIIDRVLELLEI
ncbi:MAG: hypothetical protein J7647_04390 [Cyanobacteria bacterium SBLK]|nr:hypothetical protein [Cyanobacteria bacterium SBLK]